MKTFLILINVLLIISACFSASLNDDAITFRDDQALPQQDHLQPPQLPVIDHLENDPSTIFRTDYQQLPAVDRVDSKPFQSGPQQVPSTPPNNPSFQGGFQQVPSNPPFQGGSQQQASLTPPNNPSFQGGFQQQAPLTPPNNPSFQGGFQQQASLTPPNNPSFQGVPQQQQQVPLAPTINPQTPPIDPSIQDGSAELDNRFGIPGLFDLGRNEKGEFTASFSNSRGNLFGGSTSSSHSIALGADFQKGLTLSHTGSRTSSTGGFAQKLLGLSGSRTSSQSSSLNAGLGGIGGAHSGSSAGSIAGNFFGKNFAKSGSNSRAGAAGLGQNGLGAALGLSNGYSNSYDGQTNAGANSFTQTFGQGAKVEANGQGNAFGVSGQTGASSQAGSSAGIDLGNGFANAGSNAGSYQVQDQGSDIAFRFPDADEGRRSYYNPQQQFRRLPARWQQYDVPTAGSSGYRILKFEI